MSLLDAPKYDATKERRRIIGAIVLIGIVLGGIFAAWTSHNFPGGHTVSTFQRLSSGEKRPEAAGILNLGLEE